MRRRQAREHHVRRHFVGQIYITLNEIARMPSSCCAFGCQSRYKKSTGMKLFRFPTEVKQRNLWIAAVGRKAWVPNASSGERAIGRLKNYSILSSTLPVSILKTSNDVSYATIDKILITCAALSNLHPCLV